MLRKLRLIYKVENPKKLGTLNQSLGSVFNSLFMSDIFKLDSDLFDELHNQGNQLKPFKLSMPQWDEDNSLISWQIISLNKKVSDFLEKYSNSLIQKYEIEQEQCNLVFSNKSLEEAIDYQTFMGQVYKDTQEKLQSIHLNFKSPTTFNWVANKNYYPLPDPRLILLSAINKWNCFSPKLSLKDDHLLEELLKTVLFNNVIIYSRYCKIGGIRIPSFIGSLELKVKGSMQIIKLLALCLKYLEYCGAGAKAQFGMGDVKVEFKFKEE